MYCVPYTSFHVRAHKDVHIPETTWKFWGVCMLRNGGFHTHVNVYAFVITLIPTPQTFTSAAFNSPRRGLRVNCRIPTLVYPCAFWLSEKIRDSFDGYG